MQLTLADARQEVGRGGWRRDAGRRPGGEAPGHVPREEFDAECVLHVTWRLVDDVPSLRREAVLDVVRAACSATKERDARVVEYNVLGNHLHLVVEAANRAALSRGMNGLGVRLAKNINKVFRRSGELFAERYHVRVLRTPREVYNVLRYVLLNARHHAADRGETLSTDWIDPFSSGPWFDGWQGPVRRDQEWMRKLARLERPTAVARTWLLRSGWRRHGLLRIDDVPGAKPRKK